MTYPSIQYKKYARYGIGFAFNLFLFSYNYNALTYNIRLRHVRYIFPVVQTYLFGRCYWEFKTEVLKVNLFDEYISLRAKELVDQNEYLWEHEDWKRFVFWCEDYKETLMRIHRQANNHDASDFKDSELILQDFIKRYSNPLDKHPMPINARSRKW